MKPCLTFLAGGIFLLALPSFGLTQQDAGIPPMLESPRPLAQPEVKPDPQPSAVDPSPKAAVAQNGKKDKKAKGKKAGKQKASLSGNKKGGKAVKKKGEAVKPQSKAPAKRT